MQHVELAGAGVTLQRGRQRAGGAFLRPAWPDRPFFHRFHQHRIVRLISRPQGGRRAGMAALHVSVPSKRAAEDAGDADLEHMVQASG